MLSTQSAGVNRGERPDPAQKLKSTARLSIPSVVPTYIPKLSQVSDD